jgi:hypothetical protein
MVVDFPDLPHLLELQKELWLWPSARAAVMVGAGFSLNAIAKPGISSPFPTWKPLARAMFDALHPIVSGGPSLTQLDEWFKGANWLRLASEYEAAFGEGKLDQLIRAQIPDSKYLPGTLHRKLMELPWVDVFTTNYDTLLERTTVIERTYRPISAAEQLATAFSPRIVKLHGCFQSNNTLIITEEHFRRYPKDFAPFVNTVQQSLLENSFVLLGFSGDDPNFLAWIGWIRDELGDKHSPIYLVNPFPPTFSNADRRLLERRGVTPIDLSPPFRGVPTPRGLHAASIEWFLDCLAAARPPRPERWPDFD